MIRRVNPALKQVGTAGLASQRGWNLHEPAGAGDVATCSRLLAQGADVNATDSSGWTALRWAVQYGHERLVSLLLEHNADPNVKFAGNKTCLHQSAYMGNRTITKALCDAGANANAIDDLGFSVSDIVYCPKDEDDDMRELLKTYGGKRHKTAPDKPDRRDAFIYVAPDEGD